jgi:hypothetical protein
LVVVVVMRRKEAHGGRGKQQHERRGEGMGSRKRGRQEKHER